MRKILSLLGLTFLLFSGVSVAQEPKNPYAGKAKAIKEGEELFQKNCVTCHGKDAKGDIGPDLTRKDKKYGNTDKDLFQSIAQGRAGGMPRWDNILGKDKIWKIIAYLRTLEK